MSQEIDTTQLSPVEETKASKIKRQSSAIANDPNRFQYGVLIRGKFIGVEDVKQENGDDVCQTAMIKLKAVVLAKKEHKQRICLKINLDGVEILDEKTNQTMFKHSVSRISYIARDVNDSRAIGYIYKNSPNNFQYFAIKTEKQAQELFNTLKDLFEVVLEMRNKKKEEEKETKEVKEDKSSVEEKHKLTTLKSSDSNDQIIGDLKDTLDQMNAQSLVDLPTQSSGFEDSYQSSFDKSVEKKEPQASTKPSNDLFDLIDSTPVVTSPPPSISAPLFSINNTPVPATNAPPSLNDKYSSLLNELSSLSTNPGPAAQVRPAPPAPMTLAQMGGSPNPFGVSPPMMQQPQYNFNQQGLSSTVNNPFGGYPMQQTSNPMGMNQMQSSQFPMQRPAPVPGPTGGMFMQPMQSQPQLQANPFANVTNQSQQNTTNNQFPW